MAKLFISDINGYYDIIECEENDTECLMFLDGEVIKAQGNNPPPPKKKI